MLKWFSLAIWHSIVLFGTGYFLYKDGVLDSDGQASGLTLFGNLVFTGGIFVGGFAASIDYSVLECGGAFVGVGGVGCLYCDFCD